MKVDPKGQSALSCEEMTNITGGSITETVVKIVWSVTEIFFSSWRKRRQKNESAIVINY